jgi:predicted ATP-grasp superfamily ATP-dependent carboligase
MPKNVLVFPCGSEIGLEIYKSVGVSTHFKLYGGSSVADHGKYVYDHYIDGMPFITDDDFISKLNEVVREYKIDYIFPAHDSVVLLLAQAKANGQLECDVITSPVDTAEVARSKGLSYTRLQGVIPVPIVYESVEELTPELYPVFLKPDVGQGSKGTVVAQNKEDVMFFMQKDPSLLILELLPGKEYTIDCFTDKNGTLLIAQGRERKRISGGISVSSEAVSDERFHSLATAINGALSFRGVWFFQVKERVSGELVLMEIAPRIAGTMGLIRCQGVNMALLSLFDAMGYDVSVDQNAYGMAIDRALENRYSLDYSYSHVYLDYDDLVIYEGKVNPAVMAFIYQCHNSDIQVHLLTRHKDDLHESLKQHHLSDVFNEIVWLQDPADEKYTHIDNPDAIFIDDSFAERQKVQEHNKIPVFDAHMIESLMRKF